MGLKDRVIGLEEEIKKEQEELHEINTKSQECANKIAELRKLKEAEQKLSVALKGLKERKDTAKDNLAKQEEIIEQEGENTNEHVNS